MRGGPPADIRRKLQVQELSRQKMGLTKLFDEQAQNNDHASHGVDNSMEVSPRSQGHRLHPTSSTAASSPTSSHDFGAAGPPLKDRPLIQKGLVQIQQRNAKLAAIEDRRKQARERKLAQLQEEVEKETAYWNARAAERSNHTSLAVAADKKKVARELEQRNQLRQEMKEMEKQRKKEAEEEERKKELAEMNAIAARARAEADAREQRRVAYLEKHKRAVDVKDILKRKPILAAAAQAAKNADAVAAVESSTEPSHPSGPPGRKRSLGGPGSRPVPKAPTLEPSPLNARAGGAEALAPAKVPLKGLGAPNFAKPTLSRGLINRPRPHLKAGLPSKSPQGVRPGSPGSSDPQRPQSTPHAKPEADVPNKNNLLPVLGPGRAASVSQPVIPSNEDKPGLRAPRKKPFAGPPSSSAFRPLSERKDQWQKVFCSQSFCLCRSCRSVP
eukprot:NODE_1264_length_1498_cov_22.739821_g1050_i0.p1 GENE.NODE_1264_length_1498_cov_22.739821_g1050_i0~~NODE_1264_length_1498_cov_22.739821_g1050_i0.p1  ORF type:complete len:476 (-),score=65.07 NODE_1264_length_1498_cov_22.739821_g1050_i0:71-1399(-)